MAIPKEGEVVKVKLYVHMNNCMSSISVMDFDMSDPKHFTYPKPLLGSFEAEFIMPSTDCRGEMIELLKDKLEKLNAEFHSKKAAVENQINNLLAIGHSGE